MRPLGWSKRSVQLECESCGAHQRLEFLPYLSAVKRTIPLECSSCGVRSVPKDRRRERAATTVERRAVIV
jgi:ribosomal protein L33